MSIHVVEMVKILFEKGSSGSGMVVNRVIHKVMRSPRCQD
jgi:hypothetical protein